MEFIALIPYIWILPVTTLVLIALTVLFAFINYRFCDAYSPEWYVAAVLAGIFSVIGIVSTLIALVPYNTKYYGIYEKTGTIASVTNAFTEGSGKITQSPVITLDDGTVILTEDLRLMEYENREVSLACTYGWVYAGTDTLSCTLREVLD